MAMPALPCAYLKILLFFETFYGYKNLYKQISVYMK